MRSSRTMTERCVRMKTPGSSRSSRFCIDSRITYLRSPEYSSAYGPLATMNSISETGTTRTLPRFSHHVEASEPWHLHVEEHQVRIERVDGVHRRVAVVDLANDLDASLRAEHVRDALPRERFVVDDQDANGLRHDDAPSARTSG